MPLISISMPSYNHGKFVAEAIESIRSQNIDDWELLIVDDASEDESKAIIQNYAKGDSRISAVFHEKNMGIARTINDGLERVSGKYISFVASDDVWTKDKLKRQIEILEKDDNLIVWSEGEIIDANSVPTGKSFTCIAKSSRRKKNGNLFEELLQSRHFMLCSSIIVKRDNVKDIRFSEEYKYLNDIQYELEITRRYKCHFIETPLVKYRVHGRNISITSKANGDLFKEDMMLGWSDFKHR